VSAINKPEWLDPMINTLFDLFFVKKEKNRQKNRLEKYDIKRCLGILTSVSNEIHCIR